MLCVLYTWLRQNECSNQPYFRHSRIFLAKFVRPYASCLGWVEPKRMNNIFIIKITTLSKHPSRRLNQANNFSDIFNIFILPSARIIIFYFLFSTWTTFEGRQVVSVGSFSSGIISFFLFQCNQKAKSNMLRMVHLSINHLSHEGIAILIWMLFS